MGNRIAKAACGLARKALAPWREGLRRFHRDQRGAMLDYVMVLAVLVPMVIFVFLKLSQVLSDYFGMIAFYASWPFL